MNLIISVKTKFDIIKKIKKQRENENEIPVTCAVLTHVPSKWLFVDLEYGKAYIHDKDGKKESVEVEVEGFDLKAGTGFKIAS